MLCFQSFLAIPGPTSLGEVVHRSKLDEGGKDESVADGNEPIHGRGVGHFGKRVPGADAERGHSQHSGHPCEETEGRMSQNEAFDTLN